MDSILPFLSPEKDVFYLIGQERVEERVVGNLLTKMNLTVNEIADIAEVSVEFVEDVKRKLTDSQYLEQRTPQLPTPATDANPA